MDCMTMIGSERLRDLWRLLDASRHLPGDFVQAGVWRGGVAIFARAYFHAHGVDRKVFACDSFRGFPPEDLTEDISKSAIFAVSA